jgi:hypothetical protein
MEKVSSGGEPYCNETKMGAAPEASSKTVTTTWRGHCVPSAAKAGGSISFNAGQKTCSAPPWDTNFVLTMGRTNGKFEDSLQSGKVVQWTFFDNKKLLAPSR